MEKQPFSGWFKLFSCLCCAECATWKLIGVCVIAKQGAAFVQLYIVENPSLFLFSRLRVFGRFSSTRQSPLTKSIFEAVKEFSYIQIKVTEKFFSGSAFLRSGIKKCEAEELTKRISSRREKFRVVKKPGFSYRLSLQVFFRLSKRRKSENLFSSSYYSIEFFYAHTNTT